jgi:hypothetical protein
MKITISVADVSVDVRGLTSKAENDRGFWTFAASEWHRLYEPYVPMDTGVLKDTVAIRPKEIEHTSIYARYQYNGTNFNFRRDKHPKASAKWDQAAAGTQLPKLASSMQNYIDSGRLKLD